jgi:hypothetical protein
MKRRTWLATAFLLGLATGCVERRMTINSDPPEAEVYVNHQPYGYGPADVPFVYNGVYHFTLVRDGYETLQIDQPVPPLWYEWIGIDFFTENLWPGKFRDIRCFNYAMQPLQTVPPADVLSRGNELRARAVAITPLAPDGRPLPPSDGLPAGSSSPPPPWNRAPKPVPPSSPSPQGNILNPGPPVGSGDPNNPGPK